MTARSGEEGGRPAAGPGAVVVDMRDHRPVWTIPDESVQAIREALPGSWELRVVESVTDGSGDGSGGPSPEALDAVRGARVYMGFGIPPSILHAGSGLEWVHSGAAGVGSSLTPELRESGALFTNSAGIHGPPMAETVIGMILHFARGLDLALEAQQRRRWDTEPFLQAETPVREVGGSVVGILGFGGIGREVHRRARALGARVLGLKRTPAPPPDDGTELLTGKDGLRRILGESDYLVVSAPDTRATRNLLDRDAFARIKEGAVVVNVARGRLLDEEALAEALREGRLRGAALDVFREEPLPKAHPLRDVPGLLITPHVSGVSREFWQRETELIVDNLGRYLEGRRPLRNEVDPDRGY